LTSIYLDSTTWK